MSVLYANRLICKIQFAVQLAFCLPLVDGMHEAAETFVWIPKQKRLLSKSVCGLILQAWITSMAWAGANPYCLLVFWM